MNQHSWDSSFIADKVTQKGIKRQKPRLPLAQRLSFSVGHFLNDAVMGAWTTYLIIFQTKVLGMSNRGVGFLSVVSFSVDTVVSLFVGYICDNLNFPLCAKRYGKRKSFHLLGTILVAGLFPFLMMPCFVCGKDSSEWNMIIYYGIILITHNVGWVLSQVTHLALIPETAKRPSEMVELHALRSGITFVSGIFTYVVTWILLRTDRRDESISASNWKDFLEMAIIVVGTGCFFSLIFHVGTKEPPAKVQNGKTLSDGFVDQEKQRSRTASLPLPDNAVGAFCLYDEDDPKALPVAYNSEFADPPMEVTEQDLAADTVVAKKCELSFSNPGFKTLDEVISYSKKTEHNENLEDIGSRSKQEQQHNSEKFSFSNPAFISQEKQSVRDELVSQKTNGTIHDSRNEILMEERLSNRSDSDISEGYASSPETDSICSTETQEAKETQEANPCQNGPRSLSFQPSCGSSFSKETGTSFSGLSVIINKESKQDTKSRKTRKSWIDWFKNPMFYKVSFAYMCARLVQVYTPAYAPMYMTDTLGCEKESIAYFPLVILVSGVFSSLGAKKLDKMLGAKWTFCLAASTVVGSSAWFYLQTTSGRNAVYCAAILLGFGGSVMYVTSTSLAGELIGDSKDSGAFVFSSMGCFAKVACGGAIFLTQQFFPTHRATSEYVRYAFSVVPGVASILGFLAVIAFLPATVRCRKVVHTVDASVQTEDIIISDIVNDNPVVLYNPLCKRNETVIDMACGEACLAS